ncbi:chemotaxis protein CheY, partial [Microbacterium ulmi]
MSTGLESVRLAWSAVPEGGDRRAVAWGLVRELLGDAGPSARLTNPCAYCGGPHGPLRVGGAPYLAGIAYARDLAVAAVVDAHATRTFAIDAEPDDASGAGLVLGAGAGRTVRDWVRVEAALKADGRGLRVDPALVEVRE